MAAFSRWAGGLASVTLVTAMAPVAQGALTLFYTFEDGTDETITDFAGGTSGTRIGGTIGAGPAGTTTGNVLTLTNSNAEWVDTNRTMSSLIGAVGRTTPTPPAHDYTMMAVVTLDTTGLSNDSIIFGQNATSDVLHNGFRNAQPHQGHWAADTTAPATTKAVAAKQYHIAFRYADTDANGTLEQQIFLDGVSVAGPSAVGGLVRDINMIIGAMPGNDGGYSGTIDNVRVFDTGLSNAEIASFAATDVTLVPEPGTLGVLGMGLAGLLVRRRRQVR